MNCFAGAAFTVLYSQIVRRFVADPPPLQESRIGPYRDLGAATIDLAPSESRWCLLPERAINPFFALQEISWILSGSNLLAPLQFFIKDFGKFSDDGRTLEGAYGHRLRIRRGFDQLDRAVELLRGKPQDRRICLMMWDVSDLGKISADIPCNVALFAKVRSGALDISVVNRSNDLVLGVPYNMLQFHGIQVYLANALELAVGRQIHFTDSLHVYEQHMAKLATIAARPGGSVLALSRGVTQTNLSGYIAADHLKFCDNPSTPARGDDEFARVRNSYLKWKDGDVAGALELLPATESGLAASLWFLERKRDIVLKLLPEPLRAVLLDL